VDSSESTLVSKSLVMETVVRDMSRHWCAVNHGGHIGRHREWRDLANSHSGGSKNTVLFSVILVDTVMWKTDIEWRAVGIQWRVDVEWPDR